MAKLLAVSPHLDDAALSYGGRLADLATAGHDVVVYTVFAGSPEPPYSPAAVGFHEQWKIQGDPVLPRREEDRNAMKLIGATPVHGAFLDGIYRRDEAGGWLIGGGRIPLDYQGGAELPLVAEISVTIEQLIAEHNPERVVTAAAVGNHVDHQRARDATVAAAMRTGVPLSLWEDVPLSNKTDVIPALPSGLVRGEPVAEPVGPDAWETKLRAIACYASQLEMLRFGGAGVIDLLARRLPAWRARYGVASDGYLEVTWPVAHSSGRRSSLRP